MNKLTRNLLPQDTRAVEFPSAVSLLLAAMFMSVGLLLDQPMLDIHPLAFWIAFSVIVGSLHLYSLLDHPHSELLRTAMCWISGSFWLWISFSTVLSIGSITTFSLGFSNTVAFIINTVLLSEKWNKS